MEEIRLNVLYQLTSSRLFALSRGRAAASGVRDGDVVKYRCAIHRDSHRCSRLLRRSRGRQHEVLLDGAQGDVRTVRATADPGARRGARARVRGAEVLPPVQG